MKTNWMGCAPENFRAGRPAGFQPELIVLHSLGGSIADATRRFSLPASGSSAHYAVGADGAVAQYVLETDTAFHAGLVVNASSQVVVGRPRVNPNYYSIGIEHEGGVPWTPLQLAASAQLLSELAARWNIPLDAEHVIPHSAIRLSSNCPGAGFDGNALLTAARNLRTSPAIPANRILQVQSRANLRDRPNRSGAIVRVLSAGSSFTATNFAHGEIVSGNDIWYVDESGSYLWAGVTDRPEPAAAEDSEADRTPSTDPMETRPVRPPAPPPASGIVIDRSMALAPKDYYATVTKKDLIVLHFTAGRTAASAIHTWKGNDEHVATAYVIDMDGTIFEAFDPQFWAYHLGIKGTSLHDKRSIGIEIANVGPLRRTPAGDALNWWPANFGQKFCGMDESEKFVKSDYREERYFAAFPRGQMEAVGKLVKQLSERFSIPAVVAGRNRRDEFDPDFYAGFKGIATHSNFRRDKWDIGPAYDWETLGLG